MDIQLLTYWNRDEIKQLKNEKEKLVNEISRKTKDIDEINKKNKDIQRQNAEKELAVNMFV